MRTPRKLYLLISRKSQSVLEYEGTQGVFTSRREADAHAKDRNLYGWLGASDWRVETFVKGD